MGAGSWNINSFADYTRSKNMSYNSVTTSTGSINYVVSDIYNIQDVFTQKRLNESLNPHCTIRECRDSDEHPETIPVIIALDTTGSLGVAGVKVAQQISVLVSDLYEKFKDIEILIMGIGDLKYDEAPIQISQFESDIRIAEQLDLVYMERGGGGNGWESYSAVWYMGIKHTDLDCWKRGKKGIIITTGDEPLNPYLPKKELNKVTGDNNEADIETDKLYELAKEKFDIYHIAIDDKNTSFKYYEDNIVKTFGKMLGNRFVVSTLDELKINIVNCIERSLSYISDNRTDIITW